FGDLADDREAESGPAELARAAGVDTVEALEDVRQVLGRNSNAGVADGQFGDRAVAAQGDVDRPAGRGVANGVLDQVPDQLAQPFSVSPDGDRVASLQDNVAGAVVAGRDQDGVLSDGRNQRLQRDIFMLDRLLRVG